MTKNYVIIMWFVSWTEIFRTLLYLGPKEYSEYSKSLEYSLYRSQNSLKPCYLRTRGILRTLSDIYNGAFSSEPYVTLTYLEPCYIWNLKNIRNPVKRLWAAFSRTLCNLGIFKILVYSEPEEHSEICQASMI